MSQLEIGMEIQTEKICSLKMCTCKPTKGKTEKSNKTREQKPDKIKERENVKLILYHQNNYFPI